MLVLLTAWQWYVPSTMNGVTQIYEIKPGTGAGQIANELRMRGIVHNTFFFKAYVYLLGRQNRLQAGVYELSSSMPIAEVAGKIMDGDVMKTTVTVIEGWDINDIEDYLVGNAIYKKGEFRAALTGVDKAKYAFLASLPKGVTLEGFLFPDTYFIPYGKDAADFIAMTLQNFDKKVNADLRTQMESQKKSLFQIITMASMVEKEVQTLEDKKIVAGILWKRLAAGMPLQVDATVDYAGAVGDSHYDTYKNAGLPKGPISNPGLDSITAATQPQSSEFWYYLSDPATGKTIFSKTLAEHNSAVQKYLR